MLDVIRRALSSTPSALDDLPSSAVFGLDKARMILIKAKTLDNVDDIRTSIGRALDEIDSVFYLAKDASAELHGIPDADVK